MGSTRRHSSLSWDSVLAWRLERAPRAQALQVVSDIAGLIEGVWSHERNGDSLTLVIEPFGRATKTVRARVEHEAERLAAFVASILTLKWSVRQAHH